MTEMILSALGPGLVCLGLGLITAAAAQRALRPPPELPTAPTPPRVVLFEPRLEDPKVVADRMVADLAAQLCRAGAQPHAGHREGGRQLWVQREEVYGVEQWTVSVLGALVAAETDLDRLARRIADVIRDWRARDAAEREERDVRWGVR